MTGTLRLREKWDGDLSKEEGYEAAKVSLLNALANIREAAGSLDRVQRIVKMTGYVASHDGFSEQPYVINGASDLLVAIFGEAGRHARAAVGVAELPSGRSRRARFDCPTVAPVTGGPVGPQVLGIMMKTQTLLAVVMILMVCT